MGKEGAAALMALNPLLSAPGNQGTVFIGAGYRKEVEAMLSAGGTDGNKGLVRRLQRKIMFADYSRSELEEIWDLKCRLNKPALEMAEDVRKAALDRIVKQQRAELQVRYIGISES